MHVRIYTWSNDVTTIYDLQREFIVLASPSVRNSVVTEEGRTS